MGISKEHCPRCKGDKAVKDLDDTLEDVVNNPSHYKREGGIEAIEAIQSALTEEEFKGFCKGNIIKYTWRSEHKGSARECLEKAQWYLRKLVSVL